MSVSNNDNPIQAKGRLRVRKQLSPQRKRPNNVEVVYCYRLERQTDKPAFEIPQEYREFSELFNEEAPEEALPPHRNWDHAIDLKPGTQPKKFKIYPLTQAQRDALDEYVNDFISKGFIRESKSPAGYPVFYMPKLDGGLRLYIDYRHLNEITIKNAYTLPLISELRDRL